MRKVVTMALVLVLIFSMQATAFGAEREDTNKVPSSVLPIADGLIVTDVYNNNIVLAENEEYVLLAGKTLAKDIYGGPADGYLDGVAESALFAEPYAAMPFLEGYAVSDSSNNVIRYIKDGRVQTLAGSGKTGDACGKGSAVAFNRPTGLAVDEEGSLYIADTLNNSIKKMDTKGYVTLLTKGLQEPTGLAYEKGFLYAADTGNQRIIKIDVKTGDVTTLAGDMTYRYEDDVATVAVGYRDGAGEKALFANPKGIAVHNGVVYVGDTGNKAIRKIENGVVKTMVKANSMKLDSLPGNPVGLAYSNGYIYVADMEMGVYVLALADYAERTAAFTDVSKAAWYNNAVEYVYKEGLFSGVSKDKFVPNSVMTRGMFVTVLGRLHERSFPSAIIDGEAVFADVKSGAYYEKSVAWAADNGIVNGTGNGKFSPDKSITRQEMAAMLYKYAEFAGYDTAALAKSDYSSMEDSSAVAAWAEKAMKWAVANAIIKGNEGRLQPEGSATRAQVAQMLLNFENISVDNM